MRSTAMPNERLDTGQLRQAWVRTSPMGLTLTHACPTKDYPAVLWRTTLFEPHDIPKKMAELFRIAHFLNGRCTSYQQSNGSKGRVTTNRVCERRRQKKK